MIDWHCYGAAVSKHVPHNASVITVINLKGGVGKTHASWLLAGVCQERKRRLLLVDADMQANLTGSFVGEADREPGVEALFDPAQDADAKSLVRKTAFSHIDIVPANARLAQFDLPDRHSWEKTDLHLSLVEPIAALRPKYDYIVFDCPPRLSVVSFAALCASDFVIIPLEAADWGAQGIVQVTAAIEEVQRHYNPRLQLLGYLVSRFRRARAFQQSYLRQLHTHFGRLAFDTVVPDLARFEQSVTIRIPITQHASRSEEADIARSLFREVERRIKILRTVGDLRRGKNIRREGAVAA
jgi:chromosome partitioning protein